jgi:hypothetical protein
MKNIGNYNGIPCYECSHREYIDTYNKDLDNGKQIFIVDGTMIRQNVIVGHYDGHHVKDSYDGKVYYRNDDVMSFKTPDPKKKVIVTAENSKWDEKFVEEVRATQAVPMQTASYEELVNQTIDFGKYSTVVDEFFALLEV